MDVFEWLAWLQAHTEIEWKKEGSLKGALRGRWMERRVVNPRMCPLTAVDGRQGNLDNAYGFAHRNWPGWRARTIVDAADYCIGSSYFYPAIRATLLAACRLPAEEE